MVLSSEELRKYYHRYKDSLNENRQLDSKMNNGLKYRVHVESKTPAEHKAKLEEAEKLDREEKDTKRYEKLLMTTMTKIRLQEAQAQRLKMVNNEIKKNAKNA